MRDDIRHLVIADERTADATIRNVPDHIGLAYDVWAPVAVEGEDRGKVASKNLARQIWLKKLESQTISPDYASFYKRWVSSFSDDTALNTVTLASRLLVGHGNSSATEVGLTVHRTWGVPIIPGSAIKGVLANYVQSEYGPHAADDAEDRALREPLRGVGWNASGRIVKGPGETFRDLFGAPDADDGTTAQQGRVVFHDALMVPPDDDASRDEKPRGPFAMDVLTPHQSGYYRGPTPTSPKRPLPNDYDDPIPVQFLTVRPGVSFLIAVTGPAELVALAVHFLIEALVVAGEDTIPFGVGAKTSSGYGMFAEMKCVVPDTPVLEDILRACSAENERLVTAGETGKSRQRAVAAYIEQNLLEQIAMLTVDQRELVEKKLKVTIFTSGAGRTALRTAFEKGR